MAIPPLILRIYADSTGVKKGVAQANAQVNGLRTSIVSNAAIMQQALVGGLVAGIALSIKAASDLNESMNKSNVVFGDSAKVIEDFADTSAESFGIAQAEAYDAAASFGAMFDSAGLMEAEAARMSVTMTKLAADMGSFNNVPVVEMLEKLRGGLAGEAEPLRRFGVFISEARVETEAFAMGMEQVNGKFTDAQKIQARYNIILKDTKKQQGDFARTLGESLPNQLKVLKAQVTDLAAALGAQLIPMVLKATSAVNGVIQPMTDWIGKIQEFIASSPELSAQVEGFAQALKEQLAPGLNVLTQAFGEGEIEMNMFNETVAGVGREVAGAIWPFGQLQLAINGFRTKLEDGTKGTRRFVDITAEKFKEWAAAAKENMTSVGDVFTTLAGQAKVTVGSIIREFRKAARAARDYEANLEEVARRNIPDDVLLQLLSMGTEGEAILAAMADATNREFNKMVREIQGFIRDTNKATDAVNNLRNATATPIIFNVRFQQGDLPDPRQRAVGGPVSRHTPYIVGERGPELFVPETAGTIVPSHELNSPVTTTGKAGKAGGGGRLSIWIDRRRWVNEADYEVAYGGA